jgi:Uma2 family endonuclease
MPDVSFVSTERLDRPELAGMLYNGAPDLAVEILSDSNTPAQIAQKIEEYLNAGGRAVWVR